MALLSRIPRILVLSLLVARPAPAGVPELGAIPNWPAPAAWSPPRPSGAIAPMTDISQSIPFVAITPCRIADTRGNGFTGQAGPPAINTGPRTFQIAGAVAGVPAPCGIPAGADAVSFQFTIVFPNTAGNLIAWPAGGAAPTISILNWSAGETALGNGTVVPLSAGGGLSVQINAAVSNAIGHLVIDVNGFYSNEVSTFFQARSATSLPAVVAQNTSSGPGVEASSQGGNAVNAFAYGNSAVSGVYGEALGTAGGERWGVHGRTRSPDGFGAGVRGVALEPAAAGGIFVNLESESVARAQAFLAFVDQSVPFGLFTFGRVRSGELDVVGATKNFVAPHPEDPSLEIKYASVEAPTVDVYFRGTAALSGGFARIEVPDHFRFTARSGTYMTTLTPVGSPVGLFVEEEGPQGIVVRGTGDGRFHYVVYAERAEIEGYEPVQKNVNFTPASLARGDYRKGLPETTKALLVKNGTLNPDGTFNVETARRVGWTIPPSRETAPVRRE